MERCGQGGGQRKFNQVGPGINAHRRHTMARPVALKVPKIEALEGPWPNHVLKVGPARKVNDYSVLTIPD
tara:strand:- start:615 stop:824 length:210 start_codon:yes stop_codon:yes gene_type:complete